MPSQLDSCQKGLLHVDLNNGTAFEAWLQDARINGLSLEETIDILETNNTPLALLRASTLVLDLPGNNTEKIRKLALGARMSGGENLTAFTDALLAYASLRDIRATEGSSDAGGVSALIPGLELTLSKVKEAPKASTLGFEAEIRLHFTLSNAYQQLGKFAEAMTHASKALLLAESLNLPLMKAASLACVSVCLNGLGRFSECYRLLETGLKKFPAGGSQSIKEEFQRFMANTLFSMGDHYGGLKLLDEMLFVNPSLEWARSEKLLWHGLIGEDMGRTVPQFEHEWASLYNWLLEALFNLVQVGALPDTSAFQDVRTEVFQKVVEICKPGAVIRDLWTETLEAWASSLAYMKLGKFSLAGHVLSKVRFDHLEEFLDIRLWLAAARLELSLQLNDPLIQSPAQSEAEFRSVFKDAEKLPYASRKGLAQRVKRWHPTVAAYCAVMPDPIPEFRDATEMILRIGNPNTVYDLQIPPVYACELVLRGLRVADRQFVHAPLNKYQIDQRDKLMGNYGGMPYWRPVVSGGHLAFGLIKVGRGALEYVKAAKTLVADFGVMPTTKAEYAQGYVKLLNGLTAELLEGTIDSETYAESLLTSPRLF